MDGSSLSTRLVRVDIEERHPGLFYATSIDLKGLFVAKQSIEEIYLAVPVSISALYEACGQPVIVEYLDSDDGDKAAWVAMPVVAAQAALDRLKLISQ